MTQRPYFITDAYAFPPIYSGLEPEYIEEILTYIRKYPEESNEEIAVRILAARKKE